jgi:hypothetical protein
MNYEQFRAIWCEALAEAGMRPYLAPAAETRELGSMSRTYQVSAHLGDPGEFDPFHAGARLSGRWDALQAVRAAIAEEDALLRFLGEEGRRQDTE